MKTTLESELETKFKSDYKMLSLLLSGGAILGGLMSGPAYIVASGISRDDYVSNILGISAATISVLGGITLGALSWHYHEEDRFREEFGGPQDDYA